MDGATPIQIFWKIILPLSRPAVAVTALFSFMTAWNEYILALTFMSEECAIISTGSPATVRGQVQH